MEMGRTAGKASGTNIRELTQAQCLDRLAGGTVGRVGYVAAQGLQVIPVNYRVAGSTLMLSTTPRSSLAQLAEMGRPVTFEVDYYGTDLELAWSVLMQGTLRELDAAGREKLADLRRPVQPWVGEAASLHLEFVPKTFSGRVLQHHWTV
jgi:nitroimidazol reductase NimA-like FMN-containing flavoprotein (pyridoxamine 5'-phosphate oxidase superfamily)